MAEIEITKGLVMTSLHPALTTEPNLGRPPPKLFVGVVCILLLGSAQPSARAAEALDIRLPPLTQLDPPTPPVVSSRPPAQAPAGGIIATLDALITTLNAYAESAR